MSMSVLTMVDSVLTVVKTLWVNSVFLTLEKCAFHLLVLTQLEKQTLPCLGHWLGKLETGLRQFLDRYLETADVTTTHLPKER